MPGLSPPIHTLSSPCPFYLLSGVAVYTYISKLCKRNLWGMQVLPAVIWRITLSVSVLNKHHGFQGMELDFLQVATVVNWGLSDQSKLSAHAPYSPVLRLWGWEQWIYLVGACSPLSTLPSATWTPTRRQRLQKASFFACAAIQSTPKWIKLYVGRCHQNRMVFSESFWKCHIVICSALCLKWYMLSWSSWSSFDVEQDIVKSRGQKT